MGGGSASAVSVLDSIFSAKFHMLLLHLLLHLLHFYDNTLENNGWYLSLTEHYAIPNKDLLGFNSFNIT